MEDKIRQFTSQIKKHILLSLFFVLYLIAFWFIFFTKGIYIDGHFYKKSANMTSVTYSATGFNAPADKIVLEKFIDRSEITIDGEYFITVTEGPKVKYSENMLEHPLFDFSKWHRLADQSLEEYRKMGSKPWFLILVFYGMFFLAKRNNIKLYEFFNKGRAAGESYYRTFDRIFTAACIAGLIYLILPI